MKKPQFLIAKEGFPFILFSVFITFICSILGYELAALAGLLVTTFVTYFFRDPARVQPDDDMAVISPADGKVICIEEISDDRFFHKQVIKISIFMNVFNVHVNRIPYPGTVERVLFKAGKFYSADKDKAALKNEYCALIITTPAGLQYGVVQIAGLIARRIVCRAQKGDRVEAGQRYGLIRFGSRLDLYLPTRSDIDVTMGQKVKAGETIIAHLQQ